MEETNHKESKNGLKFRPTVLVADSKELQGEDLIDEAHMEGLVMKKCSGRDIYFSNAFMVATKKESDVVTEKYYKIQDKVFFDVFATICRNKKFCNKEGCRRNDATAAEFVMEHPIEQLKSYKNIEKIFPVYDTKKTRLGIRYICPQTKLDEIAFPVKLYDRQMGVLIVGQFTTPEHKEGLEACVREKLSGCMDEEDVKSTIDKIKMVKNLQELVDKISDTVGDIEEGLIEYYEERQNRYVLKTSSELIENLKREIKEQADAGNSSESIYPASEHIEYYSAVGECIKKQLETLCDTVGVSERKVFTPNFDNLANNRYDEIKGDAGLKFHFAKWRKSGEGSKVYGNLEKYIEGIEKEYDLLLVADTPTYPIALAVCSKDFLDGITEEERDLLQRTFNEIFKKFAEYSQMAGVEAKSDYYRAYLDSYMSIQRHELGQSNAGYQMLIEEFENQRDMFASLIYKAGVKSAARELINNYLKHSDNFIRDSKGYLNTTMIRIQSTKYLIDFSDMEKTYFYPYDAFLFKWNHIYELKAEREYLHFHFPEVKVFDPSRPRMYGNPWMIEQAAYNLTNNAIKYATRGSKVSLDCSLNETKNRYEIIVENLGVPFENAEDVKEIFKFGKRGSNNKKEGSGLGLFLTKQIAKAHGGDVVCEMGRLSKYNWGVIRLYIQYYENQNVRHFCKDEELYKCLKKELQDREDEIFQYTADCIPDNAFTPMYVHQKILKGTAKFRFTFWIPNGK